MARNVWSSTGYYSLTVPNAPSISTTGATIAAWVLFAGSGTPFSGYTIASFGSSGVGGYYYGLGTGISGGVIKFNAFNANGGAETDASTGPALSHGQWYLGVATFSPTTDKEVAYTNGGNAVNASWAGQSQTLNTFVVGGLDDGGSVISRSADPVWVGEVAVWTCALTAVEVADMYGTARPMNTYRPSQLWGYWPLRGVNASGTAEADLSGHGRNLHSVGTLPAVMHPPVYPIRNPLAVLAGPVGVFTYAATGGVTLSGSASVSVTYASYQPSGALTYSGTVNTGSAIRRVQYASNSFGNASSSISVSWPQTSTAGNTLVAMLSNNANVTYNSTPSGWTQLGSSIENGSLCQLSFWTYVNATAQSGSVSWSWNLPTGTCGCIIIAEYSGCLGVDVNDTSTPASTSTLTTGTLATSYNNELMVAAFTQNSTGTTAYSRFSNPTNGFTLVTQVGNDDSTSPKGGSSLALVDCVEASPGSYSTGLTGSLTSPCCTVFVGFVPSSPSPYVTGVYTQNQGALTLSGMLPQFSYAYSGTGSLAWGGTVPDFEVGYVAKPSGTLTFTGLAIASEQNGISYAMSGGLTFVGVAELDDYVGTGSLFLTGLASVSTSNDFVYEATGGWTWGGVNVEPENVTGVVVPVGGVSVLGVAGFQLGARVFPAGSLLFTGQGLAQGPFNASGGVHLTGQASAYVTGNYAAVGRLVISGATPAGFYVVNAGGFTLSGPALVRVGTHVQPSGGFVLSGQAVAKQGYFVQPAGGLSVSGLAGQHQGYSYIASGALALHGNASPNYLQYAGTGALAFTGSSSEHATYEYTATTGSLALHGIASPNYLQYAGSGALALTGSSSEHATYDFTAATGALTLSGVSGASEFAEYSYSPSGALVISGLASPARGWTYQPAGGLSLSGQAVDRIGYDFGSSGSLFFTGDASPRFLQVAGTGSLFFTGLSSQRATYPYGEAGGQLVLSGSAFGNTNPEGTPTTGPAWTVNDRGRAWEVGARPRGISVLPRKRAWKLSS